MSRNNALLKFLEPVLEHGTEADIAAARKQYRRNQQAAWLREKRKHLQSFLIYLSYHELQTITEAAKAHNRSKTAFIKEAALAYTRKTFLAPDITAINEIRSLLAANYNALAVILEAQALPHEVVNMLSSMLTHLETEVLTHLEHPKSIEGDN